MKTPLACGRCGAEVLVEKFSWEHTSVEWQSGARQRCEEITSAADRQGHPARVATCPAMDQSIRDAVRTGDVPVDGHDAADTLPG